MPDSDCFGDGGSKKASGRPKIRVEIRHLIQRMRMENPTWGAPRIHGELLQLGYEIAEPTISRYLRQLGRNRNDDKARSWQTFLNNHREVLAAFDFFTVPTLTFGVLYCFFVIEHGRRRILHFNVTAHPNSDWIVQQLREALPLPCRFRYALFDRDAKFSCQIREFQGNRYQADSLEHSESMAERNRRTLDRQYSARRVRSRHCPKRTARAEAWP